MEIIMEMQGVWKIYRMGDFDVPALAGIDLAIKKGEFVAITGPSGCGKSTMLNMIGCLDMPTRGKVLLEGRNISEFKSDELARIRGKKIGFGNFMEDVTVKRAPKEDSSANAVKILDDVYSLGTINDWGDQRTAKFRIYVNPDTVEGDYYFNVFITYKGLQTGNSNSQTTATHKLEDQILTIKGNPRIMIVNSTLDIVAPGSKNTATCLLYT